MAPSWSCLRLFLLPYCVSIWLRTFVNRVRAGCSQTFRRSTPHSTSAQLPRLTGIASTRPLYSSSARRASTARRVRRSISVSSLRRERSLACRWLPSSRNLRLRVECICTVLACQFRRFFVTTLRRWGFLAPPPYCSLIHAEPSLVSGREFSIRPKSMNCSELLTQTRGEEQKHEIYPCDKGSFVDTRTAQCASCRSRVDRYSDASLCATMLSGVRVAGAALGSDLLEFMYLVLWPGNLLSTMHWRPGLLLRNLQLGKPV